MQEQYNLVPLQFTQEPQHLSIYNLSLYYEYVEFVSKNNQRHFNIRSMQEGACICITCHGNEQCIMKLLDTQLTLLPPNSLHFYMRALEKFPSDSNKCCVTNQHVAINMLKNIASELLEKAG